MPETPRRSWVEQIMGMPISVLARGEWARSDEAAAAVSAVFAQLREVDSTFSTYKPDSAVSRLARGETTLDESAPWVREVADRCQRMRIVTGGLFDADRPDGVWDPSGLVKGWAAERAALLLATVVGVDWCLNAAGDVAVVSPSGQPFVVGVQDPRDPSRVATTVSCAGGGVATSGTAARGEHLYDPSTGQPPRHEWVSVTVRGPSVEVADVLATASFVAGDRWAETVRCVEGYRGLAIHADGRLERSPGWPEDPHSAAAP